MPCIRVYLPKIGVMKEERSEFEGALIGGIKGQCVHAKIFGYADESEFWTSVIWMNSPDRSIQVDLVYNLDERRTPELVKSACQTVAKAIMGTVRRYKAAFGEIYVSADPRDTRLMVDAKIDPV